MPYQFTVFIENYFLTQHCKVLRGIYISDLTVTVTQIIIEVARSQGYTPPGLHEHCDNRYERSYLHRAV